MSPPSVLSVRQLSVAFAQEGERLLAVDQVSFEIGPGECFALVGESGSGKSVTALSVLRLLPPNGRILEGSVRLHGTELLSLPEKRMSAVRGGKIGIVFQDPMTALNPVMTLGQQLAESLRLHGSLTGQAMRQRALDLLHQVGLPKPSRHLDEYPHQLSGGMRQRAMIALALAGEPELLIADEPTTALDVTLQAQILALLHRLRQETGMALWLITHDFGTVAEIADRVAVMQSGSLVETSDRTFFTGPRHPYSQTLLSAMPRLDACLSRPRRIAPAVTAAPLLEVRDLRVYYPIRRGIFQRTVDQVRAVDGVSFTLHRGETLALVGESGCGKTTLGKALLGLAPWTSGKVALAGVPVPNRAGSREGAGLQVVFQDPFASMNPRMLIGPLLEEGLRAQQPKLSTEDRQTRVAALLAAVGLPLSARDRYPHEFSGGQRQRLCIARALAVEPAVLICDEPTSALDVSVQAQVIRLLKTLQQQHGLSYLFITHDLAVVSELADRVAVMQAGRIVETGDTRQILFEPQHPYTRHLLAALPRLHRERAGIGAAADNERP